jgi:hypothetical protein
MFSDYLAALVVSLRSAALLFLSRVVSFLFGAAYVGCAAWLRGTTRDWSHRNSDEHFSYFFQTVFDVAALIAIALARYNELAFGSQSARILSDKSAPNIFRQAWTCRGCPAHHSLAVHFVHVLSPRSATTGKREIKFFERDLNAGADCKHWIDYMKVLGFCLF